MPSICLTPLQAGGKQQGIVRVADHRGATTEEVAVIYMHTGRRSTEPGVYLSLGRATGGLMNLNASGNGLSGLKVMVIDDSKTIRRTAETLLKKEGCDVLTAVDGFEALAKISDQKPAIIFVDIMMPRLDGYQTCALIKNNPQFRATPVIMLSSKDGLFDKARGRIVGAEQYLTKPFTRDELLGAIHRHVSTV
jgi:twitching motility two-component system response regulator PilG